VLAKSYAICIGRGSGYSRRVSLRSANRNSNDNRTANPRVDDLE
jgi:hypothetical protein